MTRTLQAESDAGREVYAALAVKRSPLDGHVEKIAAIEPERSLAVEAVLGGNAEVRVSRKPDSQRGHGG